MLVKEPCTAWYKLKNKQYDRTAQYECYHTWTIAGIAWQNTHVTKRYKMPVPINVPPKPSNNPWLDKIKKAKPVG